MDQAGLDISARRVTVFQFRLVETMGKSRSDF
jgi:hypothetical protein